MASQAYQEKQSEQEGAIFPGESVWLAVDETGIAELCFDNRNGSANILNSATFRELSNALDALGNSPDVKGLLISSAKKNFIVGADLDEFTSLFRRPYQEILEILNGIHAIVSRIEDVSIPTACAINGLALGGGFEICLATDFRIASADAQVGMPEVNFGIVPGYGATVRLSRLIGPDLAAEWIASGKTRNAASAIAAGAVDAIVEPGNLRAAALDILGKCLDGTFDHLASRRRKTAPISISDDELEYAFASSFGQLVAMGASLNSAPRTGMEIMQAHARLDRDSALAYEAIEVAKLAKTPVAQALIANFHKDQSLDRRAAAMCREFRPPGTAAVVGAGVMGGGIAYQCAMKGMPVQLKDIDQDSLDRTLGILSRAAASRVEKRRLEPLKMAAILNRINPTLSYAGFSKVDLVVEAVAESLTIKNAVLGEIEAATPGGTIIVTNTSTLSVSALGERLKRPADFCGMHFFNPVQQMPLVEIIRGERTSDETVARVVAFALALGKKPVVVSDCPGFVVNRLLFGYFLAFFDLLSNGARVERVDKALRDFGWPMGPGQLLDVIGLDVVQHALPVITEGYPDRMLTGSTDVVAGLFAANRFGQKTGKGFYEYQTDSVGRPRARPDDSIYPLFKVRSDDAAGLSNEEIVDRLMIPMCMEAARCVEEGVVDSPADIDMSMVYGAAFPGARGGPLSLIDQMGVEVFSDRAASLGGHGAMYRPTDRLREMAASGSTFF